MRRPRLVAVLLCILPGLLQGLGTAEAGVDRWTPAGPEGGVVYDLRAAPAGDVLFASTPAGVFRSRDGGGSWQRVLAPARPQEEFSRITPSSTDPRVLLAAALYGGLYRSDDGGDSWTRVLSGDYVQVVDHPADGALYAWQTVSAGGEGHVSVLRSRDGGITWQGVSSQPALFVEQPYELTAHGQKEGALYKLGCGRIWVSGDGVGEWRPAGGFAGACSCQLAVDPADGDRLSVACGHPDGSPAVFRSTDGGATVERVSAHGLPAVDVSDLVFIAGDLLLTTRGSGIFRSGDRGETWEPVGSGLDSVPVATVAGDGDGALRAATLGSGVQTLPSGGTAWRGANRGLHAVGVRALAVDAASGELILGELGGALRRRPRGEAGWETLAEGIGDGAVRALVRTTAGTLVAFERGGLYLHAGEGKAWQLVTGARVVALVADPARPDRVYVLEPHRLLSWTAEGLAELARLEATLRDLAVSPHDPDRLHLATDRGVGLSFDGGRTWLLEELPGTARHATSVAVPAGDREGALATGGGLFARDLFGWTERAGTRFDGCFTAHLSADPRRAGLAYVNSCRGVERSLDGGETWQALTAGLPAGLRIHRIVADPVDPAQLYLATEGGVYARRLASAPALSLGEDRFRVRVAWRTRQGGSGTGIPHPLTADTGAFWFFDPDNLELVVKVLDGRPVNGRWWVFFASLSNVEYEVTVLDTRTGEAATYVNPQGSFASRGDTAALPAQAGLGVAAESASAHANAGTGDTSAPGPLLLGDGRFRVEVEWEDFAGNTGAGVPAPLTSDTGTFWFFRPDNLELVVKLLDGRPVNGKWWVFAGALTNVGYRLTVTDTDTGHSRTYDNPAGTFASFGDTAAFSDPQ